MPHQDRFLEWANPRSTPAGFLQMRLGKSLCATRWAIARAPRRERCLIVSPLSVLPSWRRELSLEGEPAPVELTGSSQERERAMLRAGSDHRWYLINREGLLTREDGRTIPSAYARLPWDRVILDESTTIRNPKAKVTRAVLDHLADAPEKIILSGLPNPEGPEDYVTQMLFLRGEFMGCRNFWDWRAEHMNPGRFGWTLKNKSVGLIHAEVGRWSYFLTRKQAGLKDEKLRQTRWVRPPAKVMRAIREARRNFQVGERLTSNALTALAWACQLAGGRYPGDPALQHDAKLDELSDLCAGEFRDGRVVVWARHTAEIEAAAERLCQDGRLVRVVTGEVPSQERERAIATFNERSRAVLVAQPQCLKMGVDLSAARVAIVMSNYFDYEVRAQMEDRLVHPKLDEPALIIDVVCEGTEDEDVLEALTEKEATAKGFNARLAALVRKRKERDRA